MTLSKPVLKKACRTCGGETVPGIWFDARGRPHGGDWVHSSGGLLCAHHVAPERQGVGE